MRPWLLALMLAGCNRYDLFRAAGYQQQSFSNKADVLFVVDNSPSMLEESESLAVNFAQFIEEIDSFERQLSYEGLPDAVTNYVDYLQNRSSFIDYSFGITTTDPDDLGGKTVGRPVQRGDDNVAGRFVSNLACEAICFPDGTSLPSDDEHSCGDPVGAYLSQDFMDCECGGGSWMNNCGTADEQPLESVFLAMCRAVPNPPVDCFEPYTMLENDGDETEQPPRLDRSDIMSNEGLLRDGANFVVVVVSEEGDGSHRQPDGDEIPEEYVELFAKFNRRMTWVYIGPTLDAGMEVACAGLASDWGVIRMNYLVHTTSGLLIDIYDESCESKDFKEALETFGELLNNLLTAFPLQSVPVPGTLLVLVDGKEVPEAQVTGTDQFGLDVYSDGWSYRSADNAVEFHGTAVPSYDANVEVYYLPVDGMPRELPF